ncbi:MAG TPA: lipoprotein insertase outer membrane protein LolB [Steroidobacteraceae bacterium]|jgi:outer membrane lipoprotein LolB|nr:lipoprotein insertase outer membrane protein LolB [Steroidobacteraceae bacterium]
MIATDPRARACLRGARAWAATALLLCAGCATTPPAAPVVLQPWEQRLPALQAITMFELDGRVAASDGKQGFSAGLRWRQQADRATLDLSAPLGFGAAHIEQGPDGLVVTTSQGVTLTDEAASQRLAATLGFEPPLRSLRYWVLGASDPAFPAQETIDDQQRLTHLEQDGWHVDCEDYALVGQQWLPRRVTVTRQILHLKLAINTWRL